MKRENFVEDPPLRVHNRGAAFQLLNEPFISGKSLHAIIIGGGPLMEVSQTVHRGQTSQAVFRYISRDFIHN